ncbi:MAG TPA: polyprenyl diphosphate synthase, partial [Flavobacteriaceae bacterium]|nr:polyprenyl diphosphate synthase [Flavobacteriaceae bacterium]
MNIKEKILNDSIPKHIAIIMDGNGRWAKQRGKTRDNGHEAGSKSVKEVVEACAELGIKNLTLFAFSTENWNRPKLEVNFLMKLLLHSLNKELYIGMGDTAEILAKDLGISRDDQEAFAIASHE